MSTDVKNKAGGDTGDTLNGQITVRTNRNGYKSQAAAEGNRLYAISKFDLKYTDTSDPTDAFDTADRFDDPRYYQGDAVT